MNNAFAFIGAGNMGGAIIGGIINSDIASPENVIVSDKNEQALKNINEKYGVKLFNASLHALFNCSIVSAVPFHRKIGSIMLPN